MSFTETESIALLTSFSVSSKLVEQNYSAKRSATLTNNFSAKTRRKLRQQPTT